VIATGCSRKGSNGPLTDWWREVFLLAAGSARDNPRIISDLVDCLLPHGPKDEKISPEKHSHVCLAATALAETGSVERVRRELAEEPEGGRFSRTHHTIQQWLQAAMRFASGLNPRLRAGAGRMLGALGDPRPGVGLGPDGLPDMVWLDIGEGPFIKGQGDKVFLKKPFQISKYPVTVAQFRAFVEDGGYAKEEFWTRSSWQWRQDVKVTGPRGFFGGVFATENHPVVGVSWYEAMAFCSWVSRRTGWQVSLPTEVQWERAARGSDGREYPFVGLSIFMAILERQDCKEHQQRGSLPKGMRSAGPLIWRVMSGSGVMFWKVRLYWGCTAARGATMLRSPAAPSASGSSPTSGTTTLGFVASGL